MSKKWVLIISVIILVVLIAIGFIWFKNNGPIKDTSLKDDGIGKLAIGMDEEHIRHYYPEFAISHEKNNNIYYYNDEDSFVTTTEKKRVVCLELKNEVPGQKLTTKKNVTLGSSLKEVEQAYGKNYRKKSTERYGNIIEFQDSKTTQKLVFGVFDDKVSVIILYDYEEFDYQF
ncbi:hypothetical protein HCJ39_11845 [Listeria rocourtiae]|uniref:hypothetical protein n=1 Tax=Listeria rocourtiae TaxID=647910 RepID=UPI001627DBD5|nr:hypothetical protein [Listeria rocourtiae]MBC1436382.1 hypothetical protein [Listeria rocourtiae]MBC1605409.1 hypothetical protein [Listeria rocourtiae]